MAIQELNTEYADKVSEIRNNNAHDEVVMSGSRAEWKEILAVYSVKINTDPENAQDVATMDESKLELLRSVFWDMNVLTSRTETKEVTEESVEDDGNEDFTSTETTVTKTILYITVTHKTADEMATQYGFTEQQKAQLAELLSDEYASLWSAVLYGIPGGSGDIVAVAISQIGNVNGEPYWSWYGFDSRVAWCATFVSWCANECGYIDAGIIPKFAACESQGIVWFTERGLYQESSYIPAPGDIIFFDWEQDGHSDHVGIVEYVEGEVVHTVEGNISNSVARRSYRLDSNSICGYGTPMY
jgi:cell wall-associated NlpC family hydrolase